jgi:hypothetical protein
MPKRICTREMYLDFQAKTASETVERIRTSVLVTLEEKVQTVFDTVLGSQGLQIKLAAVERTVRNGTVAGTVSSDSSPNKAL